MTAPRKIPTTAEFTAWLSSTPGGESVIYHTGFLARDTADGQDVGLVMLAHAVWEAAVARRVYLTQGKIGVGDWDYMATAPIKGTKVPESFAPLGFDVVEKRTEYQKTRRERLKGETESHA